MNSQKRVLLALVGIVFIAYAIYAHLLLPGIVLLVVIFVSAMFSSPACEVGFEP